MLSLERADLLQLEPISNRGTLRLLPLGKKNKQKLVIGDDSGQISCYEFKKGEPQVVFQTKIFEGPITCVALGGNPQKRDKIFMSHSQRIVGVTKKGKEFFKLTSSLTETIQNIAVEDTRIWTGCEHIFNLFDNGKDAAYYVAKGQINDLVVSHLTMESDFDAVLACHDKYVRIIHGSQLFMEVPINNAVTAIWHFELDADNHGSIANRPRYLLYGTSKGELGLIQISTQGSFEILWEIRDEEKKSEITCITSCDLNKDFVQEIVVGRDDGRLDIYKLAPENILMEPSKIFSKDIGQSIRSVVCGVVNTPDFVEVVVASYSGKIISFTTEPVRARAQEDTYGRSIQTINNENRIKYLRKEVEDLRKKVEKERDKVKKLNIPNNIGNSSKTIAEFPANAKFDLDTSLAAYVLQIELQSPIDLIILQCPVILDLVDTEHTGNAVLSVTPPHLQPATDAAQAKYVAVFRCQSAERRISLTLRTNEGEYGDLNITIVAATTPKAAKVIKYELKPLSLHTKIHRPTDEELARPRNRIRYTGTMTMGTIYEWMDALLPDMPSRVDEDLVEQKHYFRNTFTKSVAIVEFRKNEIIIESESASTIAIAKETVTRLANYRRVNLEESVTANEQAVLAFLHLLRDKFDYQLYLSRKVLLVDAVQELAQLPPDFAAADELNSGPGSWLPDEYKDILENQEDIRKEYKTRTRAVEYLTGIVTDLFVDYHRIQGQDVKHRILALQQHVLNMNMSSTSVNEYFDGIVKYFTGR